MRLKIVKTINEHGFLAKDVARKINIDPNTLSRYDTGKPKITLERIYEISKIIGCKVDDFIDKD